MRLARFLLCCAALAVFALPAAADSYLWEVSSLTNRIYLFGTVHAGRPEWYPLPVAVENAYVDSTVEVAASDCLRLLRNLLEGRQRDPDHAHREHNRKSQCHSGFEEGDRCGALGLLPSV